MIRVNDQVEISWHAGMTVEDVLRACGFTYPLVVVSVNGHVVSREAYEEFVVEDGDEVKALHLVAGG
jgi:sulfur carrier protein